MFKSDIGLTEVFIMVQLMLPDDIQPDWIYLIAPMVYDILIAIRSGKNFDW